MPSGRELEARAGKVGTVEMVGLGGRGFARPHAVAVAVAAAEDSGNVDPVDPNVKQHAGDDGVTDDVTAVTANEALLGGAQLLLVLLLASTAPSKVLVGSVPSGRKGTHVLE